MNHTTRVPRWTRPIAVLLLAALSLSCFGWRPSGMQPAAAVSQQNETRVRLTLAGGEKVVMRHPQVVGDSIVGIDAAQNDANQHRSVATVDVTAVEFYKLNRTRTLLAAAAGVTLILVIASDRSEPEPQHPQNSCPLVYAWDGTAWQLESGTFGGAIAPALARTEIDVLSRAVTEDGLLRLKVANEQPETDHVDAIAVLAVDHDRDVTVAVGQGGRLHTLGSLHGPITAMDDEGRDVLSRVAELDDWSWESALRPRDAASRSELRDGIELSFERVAGASAARLVVDARTTPWASYLMTQYMEAHGNALDEWFTTLDAEPERASRLRERIASDAFLRVSVLTTDGWQFQGLAWDAPPELVRRQAVPLDLSGVRGDTVRVRLDAPPAFWLIDQVAIAYGDDRDLAVRRLAPEEAIDGEGRSVLPLLANVDGRHHVMERGDAAELLFRTPDLPPGAARTYLVEATGWYRIHTRGTAEPQRALLESVERDPGAIARLAVERMNDALSAMALP